MLLEFSILKEAKKSGVPYFVKLSLLHNPETEISKIHDSLELTLKDRYIYLNSHLHSKHV